MRNSSLLLIVGSLCLCVAPLVAQQTCNSCVPPIQSTPNWSGTLDVCFLNEPDPAFNGNPPFSETQILYIGSGIDQYMGNWFANNDINVDFDYRVESTNSNCDGADVRVRYDPDAGGGQGSPTYGIGFSAPILSSGNCGEDCWKTYGAHEMMHVFGFGNVSAGCSSPGNVLSIMSGASYQGEEFPAGTTCADSTGLTNRYVGNPFDNYTDYPWSNDYEDCWDVVVVYYFWWLDGAGDYHEVEIDREYLGWTCTPPF